MLIDNLSNIIFQHGTGTISKIYIGNIQIWSVPILVQHVTYDVTNIATEFIA